MQIENYIFNLHDLFLNITFHDVKRFNYCKLVKSILIIRD